MYFGGNLTINSNYWLQSLDSCIDLSGARSGNIVSSSPEVDLGASLQSLQTYFGSADDWAVKQCALRTDGVTSSFVIKQWDGQSGFHDDLLPSDPFLLSSYTVSSEANALDKDEKEIFPELELGCEDCPSTE